MFLCFFFAQVKNIDKHIKSLHKAILQRRYWQFSDTNAIQHLLLAKYVWRTKFSVSEVYAFYTSIFYIRNESFYVCRKHKCFIYDRIMNMNCNLCALFIFISNMSVYVVKLILYQFSISISLETFIKWTRGNCNVIAIWNKRFWRLLHTTTPAITFDIVNCESIFRHYYIHITIYNIHNM